MVQACEVSPWLCSGGSLGSEQGPRTVHSFPQARFKALGELDAFIGSP